MRPYRLTSLKTRNVENIAHLVTLPFRLIFPKSNIENFLSYVTDLKFVFSLGSFARIYIENTLYILLADQVTKLGIPLLVLSP